MAEITVGIAQIAPIKGNIQANLDKVGALMRQISDEGLEVDLLTLPETATTGYFLEGGVVEAALDARSLANMLAQQYQSSGLQRALDVSMGFYEKENGHLYNSAIYVELPSGEIKHVHRKFFLPTYGVFDEERFVSRGVRIEAFDTRFGRGAMLICEDVWHSVCATIAALKGAWFILAPVASPARGFGGEIPDNLVQYERIVGRMSEEHGLYTVMTALVGFEGGKGFSGGSMLGAPNGEVALKAPIGEEALAIGKMSFDEVEVARARLPLLSDLQSALCDVINQMCSGTIVYNQDRMEE